MPWTRKFPEDGPVVLGVCAMAKKAHSEPMTQTLNRLRGFSVDGHEEFRVVYFDEEMILNRPVEEWPLCDALIAFFSSGFPLEKAIAYARLRKPFVFNDLDKQKWLFDRRKIYELLGNAGVPVPRHVVMNAEDENEIEESEDYLQINGVRISKPLVEKPVSGEDHNIYLYYPRSQGGGSKRLFRKVQDRSSQFYPDIHTTRVHDGNSYIYEELLQTEGTDVKVYAIGPEYAHAEARKSPVVDGKVRRNARGKEERYPVILDADEKSIARKVVITFGQTICGFDLLRSGGRSYVCDVNGWSFVKDSRKFWSDSANMLRQYALEAILPAHLSAHPDGNTLLSLCEEPVARKRRPGKFGGRRGKAVEQPPAGQSSFFPTPADAELLCVVALTRHGDRTPKEKLKFTTREPAFLSMIQEFGASTTEELKIKNVRLMEEITSRVCAVLDRMKGERKESLATQPAGAPAADGELDDDDFGKLLTVRQVLTSHPFRGINRKVQLKPTKWGKAPAPASHAGGPPSGAASDDGTAATERGAPTDGPEPGAAPTEALFILKWGGELTALGEAQAEHLGTIFRKTLYPGEFGGVLRLHATYRHDLKIYASEEGRVQMTAAAFARGFLDLDGNLTPILASLVSKNEKVTQMLDETPDSGRVLMDAAKKHIHTVLSLDELIAQDEAAAGMRPPAFALPPAPHTPHALPAAAPPAEEASAAAAPAAAPPPTPTAHPPVPPTPPPTPASGSPSLRQRQRPSLPLSLTPTRAGCFGDALEMAAAEAIALSATRSPLVVAAPTASSLLVRSLRSMGNPKQALERLRGLVEELVRELKARAKAAAACEEGEEAEAGGALGSRSGRLSQGEPESYMQPVHEPLLRQDSGERSTRSSVEAATERDDDGAAECECESQLRPANGETAHLQYCRWNKLRKDLYKAKKGLFDTTKIPDVYDNAMYDIVHNEHLGLQALSEVYRAAHTLASYVVPQEYGIEKHDKVHIGLQIGSVLLRKIHHDLLSGTSPHEHEQERVHQLDSSHSTDVRSPQRHVRTRLYFTSESHIHSLFNVLRWGSDVSHIEGETVSSIFSDEARAAFDDMELCYLTHVVFRVLHKKGKPSDERKSYCVQVLVSPGVNQDLRRGESRGSLKEEMVVTPMVLSSRDDLTLEEIDLFINFFLGRETEYLHAPAEEPADGAEAEQETGRGRATVKNQFLSLSPGSLESPSPVPLSAAASALPKFDQYGSSLLNWSDLHGRSNPRARRSYSGAAQNRLERAQSQGSPRPPKVGGSETD